MKEMFVKFDPQQEVLVELFLGGGGWCCGGPEELIGQCTMTFRQTLVGILANIVNSLLFAAARLCIHLGSVNVAPTLQEVARLRMRWPKSQ
jgi:hypothetical protein